MPCKIVQCPFCSKNMRSDNCKRHEKICQNNSNSLHDFNQFSTKNKVIEANQETQSSFPDITKPANNPKLSAMIDLIVNNGESSEASAAPKKIFPVMKEMTPPRKLDYSKMISPSMDEESPIIPSARIKKYPVNKMKKIIIPRKLDYSTMIGPSSDEESEPEERPRWVCTPPTCQGVKILLGT